MRASFHCQCVRPTAEIVAARATTSTRLFQRAAREIAEAAGRPELYDTFYALYSGTMHAGDCFDKIAKGATDEEKTIKPLRHPEQLQEMVISAVSLCSMVGKLLLNRWGTHEQKARAQTVYETKIQPDFRFLTENPDLIKAPWN
jgi:hypothetical protein